MIRQQFERSAIVELLSPNCSAAGKKIPLRVLKDWGQSFYDLATHTEPQTGGWRGAG
jgi:hypothetical protein